METFSERQLAAIAAANKTAYWTLRVEDTLGNIYYWSTGTVVSTGDETVNYGAVEAPDVYTANEWEQAHTFKIVNFSGITLRRSKSEYGIHAPSDVSFTIVNSGNALAASNFSGGTVRIGLVIEDATGKELCGSWRFCIKSASPYDQQIDVECEDFLQAFLRGSYPNTRLISDIFPVADGTAPDSMCVPESYGTCYIPLRSVYAGASRYYLLGDPSNVYAISEVRSPRTLGTKIVWGAGFSFPQSTVSGWRMYQALIAGGSAGLFMSGSTILDVPTRFSRSDTAYVTNPADILRRVLRNMGLLDYDIDIPSFDAAAATFAGWSLSWNFAFWYKEDRRAVLSRLLAMCHSCLIVGEQLRLKVLSKTSQKTITDAEVLRSQEDGPSTFRYSDAIAERTSDSGYVAFQQANESQDQFIKIRVPAKSTTDVIDGEVITFPGVQDTQHVQKLGTLFYQRKFLKSADVSFSAKGTCLALRPDDVITADDPDFGGTYNVLIDEIAINADVSLTVSAIRFSEVFDDWGDLAPGAITIASDTPTTAYAPVISGPDGTTPTTGSAPNNLQGRLRVGGDSNYILLEPATPSRVSLYSAGVERLRIGNLNGFLGYVTDVYGIGVGDSSKFLKYDPTNGLRLGGSGTSHIELDLALARISVKDATGATKTAMGYLDGLAKHSGAGAWGPGDYGFWAAQGDKLVIDGDAEYKSGDWIVENDGAYLIQNALGQTIIRLGTVSGVKGLFIYDNATVQNLLAKFATDELFMGDAANFFQYTTANLKVQAGYTAPGDDNTTPGAGLKIDAGRIEAYGEYHSFGGTVMSSDGDFMVLVGKYLTVTGLAKRYPLNNDTNMTADGQVHVYSWVTDEWLETVILGKKTVDGFDWGIVLDASVTGSGIQVTGGQYGIFIDSSDIDGAVGVLSYSKSSGGIGITSRGDFGGYFVADDGSGSGKTPLILGPSSSASAPTHISSLGSLWVTSTGVPYINNTGSTGWVPIGGLAAGADSGTAAPTSGTWPLGWIRWNSAPAAGGNIGWVCVSAGTSGTWAKFGQISAE